MLLLIELGVLTAGQDALRGVRYRNETVFDTLSHASMAGGLELFIDGSGMDEQAFMNSVLFSSTQTVGLELTGTPADSKYQCYVHMTECFPLQLTTRFSLQRAWAG